MSPVLLLIDQIYSTSITFDLLDICLLQSMIMEIYDVYISGWQYGLSPYLCLKKQQVVVEIFSDATQLCHNLLLESLPLFLWEEESG